MPDTTSAIWSFDGYRKVATGFDVYLTDPTGARVTESIEQCRAQVDQRAWVNPANEIAHIGELADFIAKRSNSYAEVTHV